MRYKKSLVVFAIIIISALLLSNNWHKAQIIKTRQLQTILDEHIHQLKDNTERLYQNAKAFNNNQVSLIELKNSLSATRIAYKKIEFLLTYYFPHYCEEHLNGAPLMHIKKFDTRPQVVPPEGLQVLDELIYSDEVEDEKAQIIILTNQLNNKLAQLLASFQHQKLTDAEVIEAARFQLISIFSLGVSGFDTPGSQMALSEAEASLGSMQLFLQPYTNKASIQLKNQIESSFKIARKQFVEQPNFEDFDRVAFLKKVINPLYADLLKLKNELAIKGCAAIKSSVNQNSKNLFASNFLDAYFFSNLNQNEDSELIRSVGERMFYDVGLSNNGKMSCASCHNPQLAFADARAKSESNKVGKSVSRNAPTLLNAAYADRYFYDLRAFTLEQQAEHVIFNADEFNTANQEILQKINQNVEYQKLLKKAFGNKQINQDQMAKALSSYVLSLQSFNSNFDQYIRGEKAEISKDVYDGFNIFMGKAACGTCHFAPTFSGLVPPYFAKNESEILGVLENPNAWLKKLDADLGRIDNKIYSEQAWIFEHSFKTTTVRNAALTAPYFHNGAYKSLEQVIDFYDHGGGAGLGLEVKNQTLSADSLHLTSYEKTALIAFITSLNDTTSYKEQETIAY